MSHRGLNKHDNMDHNLVAILTPIFTLIYTQNVQSNRFYSIHELCQQICPCLEYEFPGTGIHA